MRNPATLAENVTTNIIRIFTEDRVFTLRRPIDLKTGHVGPLTTLEYPPLRIIGRGAAKRRALESFADQFGAAWTVYVEELSEREMTADARKLRRALKALVASVEDDGR